MPQIPAYKRKYGLPLAERIKQNVQVDEGGCWIWQLSKDRFGYGRIAIRADGTTIRPVAHRAAYEAFIGAVPDGLSLDHLCRTPSCVNPEHLEPVTVGENNRRAARDRALSRPVTRCKRGHEFDDSNTRFRPNGKRCCRACDRSGKQARKFGKQQAGAIR